MPFENKFAVATAFSFPNGGPSYDHIPEFPQISYRADFRQIPAGDSNLGLSDFLNSDDAGTLYEPDSIHGVTNVNNHSKKIGDD